MTEGAAHRPPRLVSLVFGRSADYVWGIRLQFLFCLFLFALSLIMGFYLGEKIPGDLLEEVLGSLPDLENLSLSMILLFIIGNNIFKSLIWMLLGVLFGVPPLLFTILNGFLVGWFSYSISQARGLPFTVAALLPHGVIEVPTILLSMAAGMGLGYQLVNRLRGRGSFRAELFRALRLFIWRIVPILVLAAVVEVTVTPLVVYLLGFTTTV